jgi:hypothetical protein
MVVDIPSVFDALTTDQWRDEMRRTLIAMTALLASTSIFNPAAPARAQTYPVCLVSGDEDGMRCDYATLDQCRATASGIAGYCVINPASTANAFANSRRTTKRARGRTSDVLSSAPLVLSRMAANETATKPWSAPIGHRQPRVTDLPASAAAAAQIPDQEDADVDRKIRSVCRGC